MEIIGKLRLCAFRPGPHSEVHKTQCQETAVLPSQIMARLVPSKIPAPLWSATQFSTILVPAFRDMTITP
jgi:hypothetical protein